MSLFTGAGVAIITPMKENGDVNYEKFAEIIEDQIAGGIDAIIVCGTTGEAATLSHEEHLSVIEACVKYVNKRVQALTVQRQQSTSQQRLRSWVLTDCS